MSTMWPTFSTIIRVGAINSTATSTRLWAISSPIRSGNRWASAVRSSLELPHGYGVPPDVINKYGCYEYASPFGGWKESGWGMECGNLSLDLYTKRKSIWYAY